MDVVFAKVLSKLGSCLEERATANSDDIVLGDDSNLLQLTGRVDVHYGVCRTQNNVQLLELSLAAKVQYLRLVPLREQTVDDGKVPTENARVAAEIAEIEWVLLRLANHLLNELNHSVLSVFC